MNVFGDYSRYYDLIYRTKDYRAEAEHVDRLLRREAPHCRTVLDLGCGTGRHAIALGQLGYEVHGVDISDAMLAEAARRLAEMPQDVTSKVSFERADVRTCRCGRRFDTVVSLFHVLSYQTSNDDLLRQFETARAHLDSGGLFVFDCWYGPAVLTDRPAVRVARFEGDDLRAVRIAEPRMIPDENVVEVRYQILVFDAASGAHREFEELHRMRYLFLPEIKALAAASGFELLRAQEWLSERPLGFDTWNACFVARARAPEESA